MNEKLNTLSQLITIMGQPDNARRHSVCVVNAIMQKRKI